MPGGVFHARYPVESKGISVDDAMQSIEDIFAEDIAAHDVAAIVLEPLQGEGGFNVAAGRIPETLACTMRSKRHFTRLLMKYSLVLRVQVKCLRWIIMRPSQI